MSAAIAMVYGVLAGIAVGIVLANWAWRRAIRAKAASGYRLEAGGALYNVLTAEDYDSEVIARHGTPGSW